MCISVCVCVCVCVGGGVTSVGKGDESHKKTNSCRVASFSIFMVIVADI